MQCRRARTAILLLLAVQGPLTAQDYGPVLRLKSGRQPAPLLSTSPGELRLSRQATLKRADPGRFHFILQYADPPTEEDLTALGNRDIRVLSYVPDNGLLVSANDDVDLTGLPLFFAGALEAENKLSGLLSDLGREEERTVVLDLHGDVDPGVGQQLATALDLRVLANPDLPLSSLMVRGKMEALRAAAGWDEVSYIYPAAAELQRGERVVACNGGSIGIGELNGAANLASSFGTGWDGPGQGSATLSYMIGITPHWLPGQVVRSEILRALAAWSAVVQVRFQLASASRLRREIEIFFASKSHGDGFDFDGQGGALAHAFYPPPNPESIAGDLHFDLAEPWQIGTGVDVFSVALHELGHSLGLGHNDDPNSVMYPFYRVVSGLNPADITEIRKLYAATLDGETPGPPPLPPVTPPSQPPVEDPPPAPPSNPDHTAPSLTITYPASTISATSASTILVRGTSSDNTGVTALTWSTTTGKSGTATGLTSFTAGPVDLIPGINRITVTARDAAGNSTQRAVTVTRR